MQRLAIAFGQEGNLGKSQKAGRIIGVLKPRDESQFDQIEIRLFGLWLIVVVIMRKMRGLPLRRPASF